MQIFLTILVLIVMLGILIATHEAGHLFMAKKFGVYCEEYSIGFGPKLFSHKRKGGETTFSVRAIPLGGYVSMYGEASVEPNEEGKVIPPERSLEGIKPWKRCLVLVAGIVVNLILSFLFCLIYATCFPIYQSYDYVLSGVSNASTSETYSGGSFSIQVSDGQAAYIGFFAAGDGLEESDHILSPVYAVSSDQSKSGYLIDSDAIITRGESKLHTVALYYPSSDSGKSDFFSCLSFYEQLSSDASGSTITINNTGATSLAMGVNYLPDFSKATYSLVKGDSISLSAKAINCPTDKTTCDAGRVISLTNSVGTDGKYTSSSTYCYAAKASVSFGNRLLYGCRLWVNFFASIGLGLKMLFTANFSSVGGVVAMGAGISQLSSYMGWGKTFFLYGGLISLNLAIFNLLPFPGLDGWGLLVTAIEKIFKKKVPQKTKNIVSNIGLALLMAFAIFITVKDIFQFIVK
jgi:membrane-associated protease RseP (regulator of RpoE activity)